MSLILPYWLQTRCFHTFSLLTNTTMLDMDSSLIGISTKRSWTAVPPWRAYTSPHWRALEWHSILPVHWNRLDEAWKRPKWCYRSNTKPTNSDNVGPKSTCSCDTDELQCWLRKKPCQNKHKEETCGQVKSDAMDRESLLCTLSECIDPMNPDSHPAGALINIVTGAIVHTSVNIDD